MPCGPGGEKYPDEPPAVLLTFADATNAATMHPSEPLLAVATGERRFEMRRNDDDDDEQSEEEQRSSNGLSVWRMPAPPRQTGADGAMPPNDGDS